MSGIGPMYGFSLKSSTIQWAMSVNVSPLKMDHQAGKYEPRTSTVNEWCLEARGPEENDQQ
jgi:hypothetical protein